MRHGPLLCRGSDHGASVSNQHAFAGRPAAGLTALGPASAGSECRSRGCPQSPPARTSRRLAGCNSRTWPLRRSPSVRTKASRRLGPGVRSIAAAAAITMEDRKTRKFFSIDWAVANLRFASNWKNCKKLASFCSRTPTDLRSGPSRTQPSSGRHSTPRLCVDLDLPLPIPSEGRDPVVQPLPRRRRRLSHRLEGPNRLRCLAPQSRFVAAHAVKQGRVKIGKAQEALGGGAGLRPWCERRAHGRRRQRFLVAGRRIVSSVRARAFAMAIGPGGSLERPRLGFAGRVLLACKQKFALDLKETGFDRAGTTKSPQQTCQPMNEL